MTDRIPSSSLSVFFFLSSFVFLLSDVRYFTGFEQSFGPVVVTIFVDGKEGGSTREGNAKEKDQRMYKALVRTQMVRNN